MRPAVGAILAAAAVLALATAPAQAEPLADVVLAQLEASLPTGLGVVDLHLTARLAALDVDPATVTLVWPRPPRTGTSSVKLAWGRQARFVPVTLAALAAVPVAVRDLAAGESIAADDIVIEERPLVAGLVPATRPVGQVATTAIAAGAVVALAAVTRPTPIRRGTPVVIEVRRGAVIVTGRGTLERPARVGEDALVRLQADRPAVTGTLVRADLVVVGEVTP